ncbi:lysophospholipid acyltransferase family protein [Stratiformator vulcanicus]|uniref:Lipid A biosynthesis lauroyl acyltransferase n=1 Tax=Stratiformator vulcanicus TaxID=2527980 RepID=A0A517R3F6_9PLAN|nr:lysophospholipid acyltransferase family protein [Stratiformator vulcanicus]QDT38422.1 Lipid A biosynthesis lauroyl acyltransferase [Stratiformator vulcanicus]
MRPTTITLRHRAEFFAFQVTIALIASLPTTWSKRGSELLADFIVNWLPRKLSRYHIAAENLRESFGDEMTQREIHRTIEQMWVHLFRLVTEIVLMPRKFRRTNMADVFGFTNRDETVRAMSSGRPVILLGGHYGNWEAAVTAFGEFGFPAGIVARDFDNPLLHDWFAAARQRTGGMLISKKGGGGDMAALMESKGLVALLCDQDAGKRGVFVPFFGREASTFKSIALLAIEYRALICVGYAIRLEDDFESNHWVRYEIGSADIIDPDNFDGADAIEKITARFTSSLEFAVRKSPEQYFWLHRRWKTRPGERRRRRKERSQKAAA